MPLHGRGCAAHSRKPQNDLCSAIAMTTKRITSTVVDPGPLLPLTACRLVALDKCPGVRPIGVGCVARRIISKSILSVIRSEIPEVIGPSQLCVGLKSGCKAAVDALEDIFDEDSTDGGLLVDASNAFNCLNRKAALVNTVNLCPALGTVLVNTYRSEPNLFINGECILSRVGATQGDPVAMAMYAMATLPLIKCLQQEVDVEQIWYADDSAAGGGMNQLRRWWDEIVERGPAFGYFANPAKTSLVVKGEHYEDPVKCFENTEVQITTNGKGYLGSSVGTSSFKERYAEMKVDEWKGELRTPAKIAATLPQAATLLLF